MRGWLLKVAKVVLPDGFIEWYRRKRATRRYMEALGYQIYDREVRLDLDEMEGRVAASRAGFTDKIVRDILERTELVLQGLDRRIEGVSARHGQELRDLREQLEAVAKEVRALNERQGDAAGPTEPAARPSEGDAHGRTID
jgi:hypothetical protein